MPLVEVRVPLQVFVAAGVEAICSAAGNVSVKAMLAASIALALLLIVYVISEV